MNYKYLIVFLLVGNFLFSQNQEWKNPNLRTIKMDSSEIYIKDFPALILETVKIYDQNGTEIQKENVQIDELNKKIILKSTSKNHTLEYYVNPNLVAKDIFENDSTLIITLKKERVLTDLIEDKKPAKKIFETINSSGSIVRGITFGNNQSASVQSSLDLQLSGKLSNDVSINAVISDHNIPIQSNGYTQNLNEFDKVFVELASKNSHLRAGHLDLTQTNHFFSNFNQKVTGIQLGTTFQNTKFKHSFLAAGSISRGEFINYQFIGQEGNQGPYRLQGNNGEQFIIILSGSERIYMNGFLLTRGEDQDYTINYNTGELTFSSRKLMTANSRITVEYLYTNQNYNRFTLLLQSNHESEKFKISTQYYSDGDQKNNPINQNLSDSDLKILENAGNDKNLLFNSSAVRSEYEESRILYKKNTIAGKEIFEFSKDETAELYSVTFLQVNQNEGDYVFLNSPINGRIYEYIEPISGIPQGNYAPIKQLIAAQNLKVFSTNAQFSILNTQVLVDLAYSNKDKNLFSSKDNNQNGGFAGKISIQKKAERTNFTSINTIDLQFIQKNFAIINRINSVEFNRDFNLTREFSNQNQTRIQLQTENKIFQNLAVNYKVNFLNEETIFNGIKNDLTVNYLGKWFEFSSNFSLLNSKNKNNEINLNQNEEKTTFLRFNNTIHKKFKKTTIGITFEGEKNTFKNTFTNELKNNSFNWNELGIFNKINDSAKFFINSRLYFRKDDSIRNGKMTRLNSTYGGIISSQIFKTKTQNLFSEIHYRNVTYDLTNLNENIVLSTTKWNKNFKNQAVTTSLLYELGSGREAQREFTYVRVTDGQGIYKWTDYNSNGIEELDEFEVAEFVDLARYNRIFTGNISFQLINKNRLNLSVNLKPGRFFLHKNKFWERINWQNAIQFANSYNRINAIDYNPFNTTNILYRNNSLLSSFQFNQIAINKWDLNLKYTTNSNEQFLFIGLESRSLKASNLLVNYKLFQNHILNFTYNLSNDKSTSENFINKRFELKIDFLQFGYKYNLSNTFQTSFYYKIQNKNNIQGEESLKWNELNGEIRYNDLDKTSITASTSYIKTDFSGNNSTLVANQMLEGFKAGNSFLWRLALQRNLTNYLQLNFNYEGRKNEDNPVIHIGNVQLRANF